jgi:hypothetical protein
MDFQDAIRATFAWKMKLAVYVFEPDHSLSPSEVGADDKCEEGKWLKGDGR